MTSWLISSLRTAHWSLNRTETGDDKVILELTWTGKSGLNCNAVGLAQLGTMPVTRRAPFVALGLWPGGHDNPFLRKPGKTIGLADMKHGLEQKQYIERHDATTANVEKMAPMLPAPKSLRRITFQL